MNVSIIIRTYNEEKYLDNLLSGIVNQFFESLRVEIIIVDSGSTDKTIEIALKHNCKIVQIKKSEFSYGRSLNLGCNESSGEILVFISGHCIPYDKYWLKNLILPLQKKIASYCYGRQIGTEISKFSEIQIFKNYFPNQSKLPQDNFFCNNANSAILRSSWEKYKFNEDLTGLEDMYLSKKLFSNGEKIGYVADAVIYHIHDESWDKIKNRFERESIALQKIMPEINLTFFDFINYSFSAIILDFAQAIKSKVFFNFFFQIINYRICQYWGSYKGNHINRKITKKMKEKYFYPN